MSRSVNLGVRTVGVAAVATMLFLAPSSAAAQTTVVLDAPGTEVTDAYIRGGSHANTVHNTDALATKANSNTSNQRRALLKFDTETRIPQGSTIQSAKLSLTLKRSDPQTRRIGVYRVTQSFQESQATWVTRKTGYRWTSAGGDFSSKLAEFNIGTSAGSKVTVDVTALVQATVKGTYGSRYSRIALVDIGSASDTSYKEFHSSEASNASNRPVLTVVYRGGSAPAPSPSTTGSRLRVLHWNLHHGVGTDGRYDLNRIATWIAKMNPDIISLNEVERYTSYGNEDQPARYAALLKAKTGRTWYYYFRVGSGGSKGIGNAVLSRFPIGSSSHCQLSGSRNAVNVTTHVNGRTINLWSTHLSVESAGARLAEVKALITCSGAFAQQRILAGDFNAQASSSEIGLMRAQHYDGWAEAVADNTDVAYPANPNGATRNSRIDFTFFSKQATSLVLRSAQVYDTRDANGVMPSDHKPLLLTFDVR